MARRHLIQIEGRTVEASGDETLLDAAARGGVTIPSSCRVGACGTCRCRVREGEVRELTDTSYLLTREELAERTILACQSVALGDVRLEIVAPLEATATAKRVGGVVVAREQLTHDIVRLAVKLDEPLAYRAGQHADVSIEGLPGVARSYSFASPSDANGRIELFVRRVPGGAFSTFVHDADPTGKRVAIDGPRGDFWLRPGTEPLLFVAGGSGLAPILAMLREASARGDERPVTLLFGAREERDLYALAELEELRQAWRGRFELVPVLSEAAADAPWSGARGMVTSKLADVATPAATAYLCGPPAMVDRAHEVLASLGVTNAHVDRFTTRADVSAPRSAAGVLDYLKFFTFHGVGLWALFALIRGEAWTTVGLLSVLGLYVLGDALLGDDTSTPRFLHPKILTVQLWLALPLLATIVFAAVWSVCPGDPLAFGRTIQALTGFDALAAREATGWGHHVSGWIVTGLMIGMVGTIPGHELTHRTWDRASVFVGRWLLAFSFDTIFAIEHVYGHHRYVATTEDPATAPRGRNVWAHVVISTLRGNVSAWKIEVERLRKRGRGVLSPSNAFLRGHLMSVALVAGAWAMGGARAALFFVACALWGKALLEIVNYMEHYGIVRDPTTPVQPRHSWNTNRRVSSWAMFNLTRHSHHHAQGEVAYQDLRPYPDAPMMLNGYLTTLVIAMIPPLWHALMKPRVLAWDRKYATARERALAAEANARAGWTDERSATSFTLQA